MQTFHTECAANTACVTRVPVGKADDQYDIEWSGCFRRNIGEENAARYGTHSRDLFKNDLNSRQTWEYLGAYRVVLVAQPTFLEPANIMLSYIVSRRTPLDLYMFKPMPWVLWRAAGAHQRSALFGTTYQLLEFHNWPQTCSPAITNSVVIPTTTVHKCLLAVKQDWSLKHFERCSLWGVVTFSAPTTSSGYCRVHRDFSVGLVANWLYGYIVLLVRTFFFNRDETSGRDGFALAADCSESGSALQTSRNVDKWCSSPAVSLSFSKVCILLSCNLNHLAIHQWLEYDRQSALPLEDIISAVLFTILLLSELSCPTHLRCASKTPQPWIGNSFANVV